VEGYYIFNYDAESAEMSDITQQTIFPGSGLNTDDNLNFVDLGSSEWRLNILVSEDGASGIITNMKGNSLTVDIADHQLNLASEYITICSYYNRLTRKVYYFLWTIPYDSGGGVYIYDNKLFCYNEDSNTLDLIFTDTANWFGFEYNYPVRDCSMIGDWLYFNTRVSEPKVIDVVRAYNYTNFSAYASASAYDYGNWVTYNGGLFLANTSVSAGQTPVTHPAKWDRIGDSYRDDTEIAFDSEFDYAFNVIKMPPTTRPIVAYGSDAHIQSNNVRGKIFRFSYRYRYFDNSYSVYSAYSDITLPEDDELYNGEIINDITVNNYITVSIYPHSPALVKEIEVVFQETSGNWKRIKVINRQEQIELNNFDMSFNFYNNESYIDVDLSKVEKIEDSVPQRANSQEIINKNILAYGGCLEGFFNVPKDEIDVDLTPVLVDITIPDSAGTTRRDNIAQGDITDVTQVIGGITQVGKKLDIGSWALGTVVVTDNYYITIDGATFSHALTAGEVVSSATLTTALVTFMAANYPAYDINEDMGAGDIYIWSPPGDPHRAYITQSIFRASMPVKAELTKKRGFKTGANHPFCIYYYDESMRRWDAQVSKENVVVSGLEMNGTTVYVPMFNEYSPALPDSTAHRYVIDWEVTHLPPVGAKYWRWGYAGNSLCSKMVQYIVSGVQDSTLDPEGLNMVRIDITPLQTLKSTITATWNQYPMSIINTYEWQKGDRIRFITEKITPASGTTLGEIIDGIYEFEILKADDTGMYVFIQGSVASTGLSAITGENTLVEIYTPIKSLADTKTVFYEFGDLMPILPDSLGVMTHQGQSGLHNQDTQYGHAAMGTFDGGDVYHIMRTPSKPLGTDTADLTKGAFHESMWYSDFYDSDDYDRGKIGFETNFGQRFLNIVRYSNQYLQNTLINGLSTFEGDNFKELNDIYGDIIAILEQGDTLKVYQERKASSILVGRTEYMDAQGNTSVAISERVFGAIRYSPSNYSTVFTESLSRNNQHIYGFDIYNGVVWRDSKNGLFPISGRYAEMGGDKDYKMQTYFKLKAKALLLHGVENLSVQTVWDEEYKNLYVTFKDRVDANNNDTVVFHEPSNRWICFTEFDSTPETGYVTPLEPTYSVLRGFSGGIGYSFDEETRFSHFDFETPGPADDGNVYIVEEDGTTYVVDEDSTTSIIE
jgi:hypothetical protein